MKIIEGKDMIITEFEEKTLTLIESFKAVKSKLK